LTFMAVSFFLSLLRSRFASAVIGPSRAFRKASRVPDFIRNFSRSSGHRGCADREIIPPAAKNLASRASPRDDQEHGNVWPARCFSTDHDSRKCSQPQMAAPSFGDGQPRGRPHVARDHACSKNGLCSARPRHGIPLRGGAIVAAVSGVRRSHAGVDDRCQADVSESPPQPGNGRTGQWPARILSLITG
jgi:hypothetical protein